MKTKNLNELLAESVKRNKLPAVILNERSLASIVTVSENAETTVKKKSQQKIKLQIFCDTENLKLNSAENLVMLELSSCLALQDKQQLWLKNLTNGFKAQIFKISSEKFKTDFIQLNKGMNKVLLEGILKDGQKIVQTLEILSGS